MGKVISVVSGKGGVGKTTITANLGIMLASHGKNVCLIDFDIGLNNLDVVLGVENKVVYDLSDCLSGKCRPVQAIIQDDFLSTLYILPCSKTLTSDVNGDKFVSLVNSIRDMFDFVIIDAPAGIGGGFKLSVIPADEVYVVVGSHISSIRDADKVIGIITSVFNKDAYIVVNKIRGDLVISGEMLSIKEIENLLSIKIIGVLPDSDELAIYNSFLTKIASFREKEVYNAFSIFTSNVINGTFHIYNIENKYKGICGLIRRLAKRRS